jgi:enamine deaminase RidA (YjgF/YER057c/UK114 family)
MYSTTQTDFAQYQSKVIFAGQAERYFLTLDLNDEHNLDRVRSLYKDFLNQLKRLEMVPVYEKVFGDESVNSILKAVRDSMGYSYFPSAIVNYHTLTEAPISSIFIYAIKVLDEDACSVHYTSNLSVEVKIGNCRHLHLLKVEDTTEVTGEGGTFDKLFSSLEAQLTRNSFRPKDIVRTWFYVNKIKQNYPEFNDARRRYFDKNEIKYTENAAELPSSTCIGAPIAEVKVIQADAYYMCRQHNPGIKVGRMFNQEQNEANGTTYLFQPTFARATEIVTPYYTEIQLSGTASINQHGESVYLNNSYQQILTTLKHVKGLLSQHSMGFEHLVQSTCFFKRKEYYQDYLSALDSLGIQNFSHTFVIGDVCRDELLFEIDGIAVKNNSL